MIFTWDGKRGGVPIESRTSQHEGCGKLYIYHIGKRLSMRRSLRVKENKFQDELSASQIRYFDLQKVFFWSGDIAHHYVSSQKLFNLI